MKDKLTKNFGTKVLSIFLSIIVWLLITNVEDPVVPKEFKDVPVKLLNRNVIEESGETFDIIENETINFTVRARRSIRDKLTKEDFEVTANLEHLNEFDVVDIRITSPIYGNEIKITEGNDLKMSLEREKLFEDSFRVDIVEIGQVNEDYVIGNKKSDPYIIFVSGPKGRVERIDKVIVEVDVEGISGQIYRRGNPKAIDEEGNEIEQLTYSHNNIYITIDLYEKKDISLNVEVSGELAFGYTITDIDFVPKNIVIAGEKSVLQDIDSITYTEDVTGINESVSKIIDLEDELPNGVFVVGDDKTAALSIIVEKLETKTINLLSADIAFKNKPLNKNAYVNMVSPIRVNVMGSKEDIDKISRSTLKAYIDLSGHTAGGTYSLELQSENSNDIKIINTPPIDILIEE